MICSLAALLNTKGRIRAAGTLEGGKRRRHCFLPRLTSARFNEAIKYLSERHLVGIEVHNKSRILSLHRALQRHLLHRLNTNLEERQSVFDEALRMVRRAFPVQNVVKRGDTSQWPMSEKYISQVTSLSAAYSQIEPRLKTDICLATLLADAGFFQLNYSLAPDGVSILQQGEIACDELIRSGHPDVQVILTDILNPLQLFFQFMGVEGRKTALQKSIRELSVREELVINIPEEQLSQLDRIGLARATVDLAMSNIQLNHIDEAARLFQQGVSIYQSIGDDSVVAARLSVLRGTLVWCFAIKQKKQETYALIQLACSLIEEQLGPDHHLTLQTKFCSAMALFTIEDFPECFRLHQEVLKKRIELRGHDNHESLASRYQCAAAQHAMGNLENAE